jgi:hypothetical protein
MLVIKLNECGYEESALGFSLSYNTSIKRAKELMPRYAFGEKFGERKFLRIINLWLDVDFPRLVWPEADQHKVATTTLSESTVHTLGKRLLTQEDFVIPIDNRILDVVNEKIVDFQNKKIDILEMKSHLPEGFLQRRIWHMNYANLQNLVDQRIKHRIKLWNIFINELLPQIEHPEFIIPNKED